MLLRLGICLCLCSLAVIHSEARGTPPPYEPPPADGTALHSEEPTEATTPEYEATTTTTLSSTDTTTTTTTTTTARPEGERIDRKCNSNIFKRWGSTYMSRRRGAGAGPAEHGVSPQCTRGHLSWHYPAKSLLIEWNRSVPYMRYVCVRFGFVPAIKAWRQVLGVDKYVTLVAPDTREMYCFKTHNRTVDLLLTSTPTVTYYMTYVQFQSPIEVPITEEIFHFMDFQLALKDANIKLEPYLEYDEEGRLIPQDPKACTCAPIQKPEDCQCPSDSLAPNIPDGHEGPEGGREPDGPQDLLTRGELCQRYPYWTDGLKVRSCRYVFDESWMASRWNIG